MPAGSYLSPSRAESESRKYLTKPDVDSFALSFERQSLGNKKKRYHWTICSTQNPDLLVSWGHAATHEMAENEARKELDDLASGRTQGGRVASFIPFNRRIVGSIGLPVASSSRLVLSASKSLY